MPKLEDVESKKNNFKHITDEDFEETKRELLAYLKNNKMTVVRDHCHFTGKFSGKANQKCKLN